MKEGGKISTAKRDIYIGAHAPMGKCPKEPLDLPDKEVILHRVSARPREPSRWSLSGAAAPL